MNRGLDRCPYFHRTSVIMADGEVVTCANFYAENAGHLQDAPLSSIWNGKRLRHLRADFGTEREWTQCRTCWFREIGYHQQRQEWHARQDPNVDTPAGYTDEAWSFTRFLDEPERG
ncbi:SPASM domain-containing protein [Acuticoccus kandeliae]|uniref:SPASM domain-containing protein n=1 Tax=Acuticoccus kandeliae TaxID=2073160 RepID=UPI000D3E932D|nr:SPASM domain-containing protein [Acuticoccus kandeliae]